MRYVTRTSLAMVVSISLLLSACTPKAADQPNTDITSEPDFSSTLSILTKFGGEPDSHYFGDLADDYMKLHPSVKIELIQETDQSIKDKTKTLAASGALPDIYFSWNGQWARNFIDGGIAADLTDLIAPESEWGRTFGETSLEAFKFDDRYYAVPLYNNAKFVGFNKRAFAEAGVEVPKTFDDLISACQPLREAGYEPMAFGNKDGWPALHYLQQLFAYNVPDDVLKRDFDPKTATWDDPGYLDALSQFKRLATECTGSKDGANGVLYTTAQENFANERSAMYYQEMLEFGSSAGDDAPLNEENMGIFQLPFPSGSNGDPKALEGAPEGYMVNSKSPNAPLAVDFLKFATKKRNAETLASPPYGQPSTVDGAVTDDTASDAINEGVDKINQASRLDPWIDTASVPQVADAWLAGGEALISGTSTPQEVLDSVQLANELVP